jgi:hypothetical protein
MQTKVCTTCGVEKEISEFPKAKFGKYGVSSKCKVCSKQYYEDNKERFKQQKQQHIASIPDYHKNYYQEHKEARKLANKKCSEKIKNNPELYLKALLKYRAYKLKIKFGVTLDDYNKMFEAQNGVCAICGKPETSVDWRTKNIKYLAVDHDHQTGKVRGLLCSKCDRGIGYFDEERDLFYKVINYLNKYKD